MKRQILGLALATSLPLSAWAQSPEAEDPIKGLTERLETLETQVQKRNKFDISGYIQINAMHGQKDASLFVGGKHLTPGEPLRLGVRRGRAKLTYRSGIATGVLQIDVTEKGVGVKDAYVQMDMTRQFTSSLKAGIFDRPFGHEIAYSSSRRETPERSQIIRTLFPNERDLGVMLTLQPHKESAWRGLKLEMGAFSGNGIKTEVDSRMDFIGHLSGSKLIGNWLEISGGVSLYYGNVYRPAKVYTLQGTKFEDKTDSFNFDYFVRRSYLGLDAQASFFSPLGMTTLRGEWITGTQPGGANDHNSPNGTLTKGDIYMRPIQGGYALLVQDLGKLPLSALVKYDWFDPNTALSGNQIGEALSGSGVADISYSTLGVGLMWRINSSLKATAYTELIRNERSSLLTGYETDRADNRFTLALQYKL